ncbi:MAG: 50S ribosomal protein L25/general stress protein Ctc [Bacteroidales bacterium]|nr:50S ribosomal protein L25/general stress protein Ctc [Bacteroidales bacterium]
MRTLDISVKKRTNLGKKSTKSLRSEGNVPCVMYGGGDTLHFYAHENSFRNLIYTHHVHMVNFDIEGDHHKAIIKEIQFHPVTDKVQHIDFIEISDNKPAVVDIPIEIKGNSIGIRNGGKLRQRRRLLKVKGLVSQMPDVLEIDISELNIGHSLKVKDLKYDNLELLDPQQSMVVGVISSRLAAKGMAAPVEAAAEGEKAEGEEAEAKKEE